MTVIVIENPEGTMKIKFPLVFVPLFFENQNVKKYEVFKPSVWRLMLSKCNFKGFFHFQNNVFKFYLSAHS